MSKKRRVITFEVPPELGKAIDKYVDDNSINLSKALRKYCATLVGFKEKEKKK